MTECVVKRKEQRSRIYFVLTHKILSLEIFSFLTRVANNSSNLFRVFFTAGILMRTSRKPRGRGVNLFVPSLFSSVCALREGGRSKQKERENGDNAGGWLSERIGGGSTDAWIYMTLPPTLTPQRGSAYIIVYLIPWMVLKICRTPRDNGAPRRLPTSGWESLPAHDIMQAVYILYIRTGIQLSLVRPSPATLSCIRSVLPFYDSCLQRCSE